MAKLFASETALELSIEAMRIHGGVGFTTDLPVERYYRDAPLMVIGEGTNEIQRIVIARGLLARARGSGLTVPAHGRRSAQSRRSTSSVCCPSPGAGGAGRSGRSEKLTGPLTERWVSPPAPSRASRKPSFAASCGSSSTSAGPCAGAHHTPSRSKRSAQTSRGCPGDDLVQERDDLGAVAADGARVGEARVREQVRSAEGPAHVGDVAVRLESREEEPAPVGGPVGVHQRRLVRLPRLGPRDLAEGGLQAEVPAEDVGPGPQERHLDDLPAARVALLEHGGQHPGQGGEPADVVPDAAAGVERDALAVGQLDRQGPSGPRRHRCRRPAGSGRGPAARTR